MRRALAVLGSAVVAALAAAPCVATAGTVSVSGTTITFAAGPGEANFMTVRSGSQSGGSLPSISDHVEPVPVPPCETTVVGVQCASAGPRPTIVVRLGDGNDIAGVAGDATDGARVELYGEDGDDDLDSSASGDLLDGGPGNDEMSPDDDEAGGGDVVRGGPGTDTLQTGNPQRVGGPITVTFDGVADDGYPGEADDYAPDLENLSATAVAPSIAFVGNDSPNEVVLRSDAADSVRTLGGDDRVEGSNGNDTIDGGDGNDTLAGGAGDDAIVGGLGLDSLIGDGPSNGFTIALSGSDRIDARDGVRESIDCGLGADTAIVDADDVVPADPGSLCEVVDRPVAPPIGGGGEDPERSPPPSRAATGRAAVAAGALRYRRGVVAVVVRCARGGAPCAGRLTLRTARRVRIAGRRRAVVLGSARYRIAAGRSATVRIRPAPTARSLIGRPGPLRVRVLADPSGAGRTAGRTVALR